LLGTGQTPVKNDNRHPMALDGAPDADEHDDAREDGWTKVIPKPGA